MTEATTAAVPVAEKLIDYGELSPEHIHLADEIVMTLGGVLYEDRPNTRNYLAAMLRHAVGEAVVPILRRATTAERLLAHARVEARKRLLEEVRDWQASGQSPERLLFRLQTLTLKTEEERR
jgi:hypothetical protein